MSGKAAMQAYRARCKAKGCCPHCGKPCAPYQECAARRLAKRKYQQARTREAPIRGNYKPANFKTDKRFAPRGPIKKWSPEHDAMLVALRERGESVEGIALILKRTVLAIETRIIRLRRQRKAT